MSAERALTFVDTNVFVYAYDQTAGDKHDAAAALVAELGRDRRGALSIQVLQELFVNVTRKVPRPMRVEDARERVETLARWRLHAPAARDVLAAIDVQRTYAISFWDAMIVRSASWLGCAVLWTEDLNPDQVYEGVRVENPFR